MACDDLTSAPRPVSKAEAKMTDRTRDELITKVQHGERTPAEAEIEAKRLNLRPLENRPDPHDYDPMREPFWTLPMAVAWIAYRTLV
jgi:hypothetical protein